MGNKLLLSNLINFLINLAHQGCSSNVNCCFSSTVLRTLQCKPLEQGSNPNKIHVFHGCYPGVTDAVVKLIILCSRCITIYYYNSSHQNKFVAQKIVDENVFGDTDWHAYGNYHV